MVESSRTFVHTVTRPVVDWLVRESVQRETCAVVGLQSSTSLVVWIVMVHPRFLSEQPVLLELLADSEELGIGI